MQKRQELYSLKEAATFLRCHPESLRRAIRKKELKAAYIGRQYKISDYDLQEYWKWKGGGQLFGE